MESAFLPRPGGSFGRRRRADGEVASARPDGFATYYLAEALRDFVARNPGLRLQLAPAPQLTRWRGARSTSSSGSTSRRKVRFVARRLTDYSLGIYASAA